ncbi:MAG: PQQ-binding-like beta-propeller repeat protein [Leptospiraceae bacterium]|nr:PQQ-binding-like beta-propeller repeat protein [Leptospiraceae bacterium]MCB1316554.1 PQQ-binding-like beta-propeller repeat protein [Leptospiraceae bacterium]
MRTTLYARGVVLLIGVLIIGLFGGCSQQVDWLTYRGENGSGYTPNALYPPLGTRWKLTLQFKEEAAQSFNPPIVKGDTIFFGSNDKNFYALDINTGYMRWIFKTGNKVNSVPYADEDSVYFGSNDGKVYAVDINTGEERWSFQTGDTVQSLVMRYRDRIIFTTDTEATYFLDLEGKEQHRIPNPVWSHHTFQVYDGVVYWAPLLRGFGAFDIDSKEFLWTVPVNINYPVWYSFPAIDEEKVYYASSFFTGNGAILRYYAADREDGRNVWEHESSFNMGNAMARNADNVFYRHVYLLDYMAPALWSNLVIYTSGDTVVRAFDAVDGDVVWEQHFDYPTSSAPTVAGDRVYFGVHGEEVADVKNGDAPRLVCLSAKTGRVLWQIPLEGAVLNAPVVSGSQMMFGTHNNLFYVLEEIF